MFPLTPDQHHWLEVATEDEGWPQTTVLDNDTEYIQTYIYTTR